MKTLAKILFVYSLVAYLSVFVSPAAFWPMGFVSLSIPLVVMLNIAVALIGVINVKGYTLFPLLALLLGITYFKITFQNRSVEFVEKADFSLASYNVHQFHQKGKAINGRNWSSDILEDASAIEAGIKCFQEYYNNDRPQQLFEATRRLSGTHPYHYVKDLHTHRSDIQEGLAIFSQYPIVHKGEVPINDANSLNNAIYADIVVNGDTIRVINIHLESMSINESSLTDTDNISEEYKSLAGKLRKGMIKRSGQSGTILDAVNSSPYPTIVCGDFNESPYSYTYFKFRNDMDNAYEQAGGGFGFTYNGRMFFLRIDHQFYTTPLRALHHSVLRTHNHSDHFPLLVHYAL